MEHLFFLVPYWTIEPTCPLFYPEPPRKRHADRMTRLIKDKHLECCHQEVKESLVGGVELGYVL